MRDRNGYRNYSDEDYQRSILVGLGKEAGFTLNEISTLLDPIMRDGFTFKDLSGILKKQLERIDRKLAELSRTRARISQILDNCPKSKAMKKAIFDDAGARRRKG